MIINISKYLTKRQKSTPRDTSLIYIVLCQNCKTIQVVGSKCGICGIIVEKQHHDKEIIEKQRSTKERSEKDKENQDDTDELKEKKS